MSARFCIRCGAPRRPAAGFCTHCGAPIAEPDADRDGSALAGSGPAGPDRTASPTRACPRCGAEHPLDRRFCTACGASLAPPPELAPVGVPWVRAGAVHPVRLDIPRDRQGRVGAIVRLPAALAVELAATAWWLAVVLAAVGIWIARLATGRAPAAPRRFVVAWLRFASQANAYAFMASGAVPGRRSPAAVGVTLPTSAGRPWLRPIGLLGAVPVAVLQWLVALLCAPVAWVAIVATGRLPGGLADVMEQAQRYRLRFWAYALVVTDAYPWFQAEPAPAPAAEDLPAG